MKHLKEEHRKASKLHQAQDGQGEDGIDEQDFEKAWDLISRDGIVNVLSVKSFILALSGIQQKWMIPQEVPFRNDKVYSSIE
jgi:hypothetical protein